MNTIFKVGFVWIVLAAVAVSPQLRSEDEIARSDAIVSEKDEVALVEDSSVGEAIGRRPDLSFSNVTIDGEDSQVSLDSISADAISSVEVMKAVTPDQDAESRGGSISLRSRPSYMQSAVSTKISLETEYDTAHGGLGYEGRFSLSGPFKESKKWGGRLSVRWEEGDSATESSTQDWFKKTVGGQEEFVLKEKRLFYREDISTEQEVGGTIDFKASEALALSLRGNYLIDEVRTILPHTIYRFSKGTYSIVDDLGALVEDAEVERGMYDAAGRSEEVETSLRADWNLGDWEVDAKYTMQSDSYTQLNYTSADFVVSGVDLRYDLHDSRFPEITSLNRDLSDASLFEFEDVLERDRFTDESDKIAAVNAKWRNVFGNEKAFLRFGAKSRLRDRVRDYEYVYSKSGFETGGFTVADAEAEGMVILDGLYNLENSADSLGTRRGLDANRDSLVYEERRSREASDYGTDMVEERVDAFYGMASMEAGRWRGLFGVRQEDTSISFASNEVILGRDVTDRNGDGDFDEVIYLDTLPRFGENSYGNFFPNAHVRYLWGDRATLIASLTNTIDRPSYSEVVPYRSVDIEDLEIDEGNPELRPTLYRNIDMSLDMRIGEASLLSVELYDRAVEDVIFSRTSIVSGGIYDGYELQRQENNSTAQIRGVSLTWNSPVELPVLPEGFSLNAKFTQQETELVYPFRPDEVLPKTSSPDSRLRLALNYETKKLFAQLKFARSDPYIFGVDSDPDEDAYRIPSDSMDLMVSYKLQKKTRVYFEWENMMNGSDAQNFEGIPYRATYYRAAPWTFATGVRMEL